MSIIETVEPQVASDEEQWVSSFSSVNVRDLNEVDETERKMWMFLLHSPSKRTVFGRKKKCQWALMVQFHDGQKTARFVFAAEKVDDKIVPVRSDYLEADKWQCKLLDTIDISPKELVDIVLSNALNGQDFGRLKKSPRDWTYDLCERINHNFLDEQLWDKKKFDKFANITKLDAKRVVKDAKRAKKAKKENLKN